MSPTDLKILSESLRTSLKRLKRDIENDLKYEKKDVDAAFEKIKLEKRGVIYILEKEFKLAGLLKTKDLGFLRLFFIFLVYF